VPLVVVLLHSSFAFAQTVAISATNRGWIYSLGGRNGLSSSANYFAGDEFGEREYRNFFFFDLTGVSQPIASAKLVLSAGHFESTNPDGRYDPYDPAENYELHDIVTPLSRIVSPSDEAAVPAFIDFGTGVVYGSRTMSSADDGNLVEIELNASAILAMNSTHGPFGIGGSITTLDSLPNSEGAFGFTGSSQSVSQLRLTLVPEPSTLMLLGIGAISLLGYRKAKS
jgi:hypothetical protein